jgi:hypothetical protein
VPRDALFRFLRNADPVLLQLDALEGAPLSVGSASLVFLEVKRDGLSDADLTQKRLALARLLPPNVWETHEFFEEIGRKLAPPWGLQWHVLPVRGRQGWAGWPGDRQFDDHVLLRREDKRVSLALPLEPRVEFEFPAANFVYPIVQRSGSTEEGAAALSGSVGVAVYSPNGVNCCYAASALMPHVVFSSFFLSQSFCFRLQQRSQPFVVHRRRARHDVAGAACRARRHLLATHHFARGLGR